MADFLQLSSSLSSLLLSASVFQSRTNREGRHIERTTASHSPQHPKCERVPEICSKPERQWGTHSPHEPPASFLLQETGTHLEIRPWAEITSLLPYLESLSSVEADSNPCQYGRPNPKPSGDFSYVGCRPGGVQKARKIPQFEVHSVLQALYYFPFSPPAVLRSASAGTACLVGILYSHIDTLIISIPQTRAAPERNPDRQTSIGRCSS